jgi:GTP cyclohydrolase I
VDTPRRVIDAVLEMTSRPGDPGTLLAKVFDDAGPVDEMVTVGPVEFTSLCEHHLLPFTGRAWLAYIASNGTVVGLSKLARLVEHHARALQVQERLTGAIADDLVEHLRPVGAGVKIAAVHSCMSVRGVRKPGAMMTTIALRGALLDKPAARAEFLSTTGGNGD